MPSRRIQEEIDRLYQLAPDAFTAARNLLAKQAGADGPQVRGLGKPPLPAWAVNQLYWKRREDYDALIEAANDLRQTHKTVLAGRRGDLRTASKAHEAALDAALKGTLSLLQEAGHPITDATRQSILTTLRALPTADQPGRLSRTLQPGGFEMLAGLSIGGGKDRVRVAAEPATVVEPLKKKKAPAGGAQIVKPAAVKPETAAEKRARERARARAQEEAAKAARELRDAEHTARREEFEAARAAREAEKSSRQVDVAKEALEAARQALAEAEAAAEAAARARDEADARATDAHGALDAARGRRDAAAQRLEAES
jgi:hypothetical protein